MGEGRRGCCAKMVAMDFVNVVRSARLTARMVLLVKKTEVDKANDALCAERQALPLMRVESEKSAAIWAAAFRLEQVYL